MTDISQKSLLRKSYRKGRAAFAAERPDTRIKTDGEIAVLFLACDAYKQAKTIFFYVSVDAETSTGDMIEGAFADGKTVCIPRTGGKGDSVYMEAVPVTREEYHRILSSPGGFCGIPEPPKDMPAAAPEAVDMIIVPSLAVDIFGVRLGYGGGYYDRYIELARKANAACGNDTGRPFLLSVQRSIFVTDKALPSEAHDERVDMILTEKGFILPAERPL